MAEQQIEQGGALRGDAPLTIDILQPEKSTPAGDDGAFSSQSPTPTAVTSDNDAGDLDITNPTRLAPQTTESQMNGLWEETGDVKDENNDVNPNNVIEEPSSALHPPQTTNKNMDSLVLDDEQVAEAFGSSTHGLSTDYPTGSGSRETSTVSVDPGDMTKTAKPAPIASTKENSKEFDDDENDETKEKVPVNEYSMPAIGRDRVSNQPLNASNQSGPAIVGMVDEDNGIMSEEPKEGGGLTAITSIAFPSAKSHTNTPSASRDMSKTAQPVLMLPTNDDQEGSELTVVTTNAVLASEEPATNANEYEVELNLPSQGYPTDIVVTAMYDGELKYRTFKWQNVADKKCANLTIPSIEYDELWFVEAAQRHAQAPYAVIKAVAADTGSKNNDDAIITVDKSKSGTVITFDASNSCDRYGKPCKGFTWDFGDETNPETTKIPTVKHKFEELGIYSVKCTVIDSKGNMAMCSMQQIIREKMKDDLDDSFSVKSLVFEAAPNQMVNFYASDLGLEGLSYRWHFGDGTKPEKSDCPRIAHIFKKAGSYSVRVEVTEPGDKGQCTLKRSATLQHRVCRANPNGPAAVIVAEEEEQKYPQKDDSDGVELANALNDDPVCISFDASKSMDKKRGRCKRFRFDFGDGSDIKESEDGKATHRYTAEGTYLVTVVVTDANDNRSSATLIHKIKRQNKSKESDGGLFSFPVLSNRLPMAIGTLQCRITPQIQCARSVSSIGQPVSFSLCNEEDSSEAKYEWDFGDGENPETSEEPKIDHIYTKPGSYYVAVTIVYKKRRAPDRAFCTHCVLPPSGAAENGSDNDDVKKDQIEEEDGKEENGRDLTPMEKRVPSDQTLHEFVDDLIEENFVMGRRLYLEWRPPIKSVVIDLSIKEQSINRQPINWKCSWADIAEWKCHDILALTEHFGTAGNDYLIGSLWSANPDESGPTERKTDDFDEDPDCDTELPSEKTIKEFSSNGKIGGTLYMKRRPGIVIDLSSFRENSEAKFKWKDIKDKTQKQVMGLLMKHASIKANPGMEEYFKLWFESTPNNEENIESIEFRRDDTYTMATFLRDIDNKLCPLANHLVLKLRHNLENIKIAVSYDSWKDGVLSYEWWELADKNYEDILQEIQSDLEREKHVGEMPEKKRVQLWFKPTFNRFNDDATDIEPIAIQFTHRNRYRLLDFVWTEIRDTLKGQGLSLNALKGTLPLEWKCLPEEIVLSAVYDGELKEFTFPWNKNCDKTFAKLPLDKAVIPAGMSEQLCFVRSAQCLEKAPYAVIAMTGTDSLDASGSRDCNGGDCKKLKFIWDFGDGTRPQFNSKSKIPSPLKEPGIYSVQCTVIDSKGNRAMCSMQQIIFGSKKKNDYFTVKSLVFEAAPNQKVNFYASDLGLEGPYRWYFGDGTEWEESDCPRITHVFKKAGSYSVRVEVIDPGDNGQSTLRRSATLQQRVCRANPNGPAAVIVAAIQEEEEQKYPQKEDSDGDNEPVQRANTLNPNETEIVNVSVFFDASESVDGNGAACNRFAFDFGDGSEIKESKSGMESHRYKAEGTYVVTVIVTDANDNRSTATLTHKIERENESKESDGGLLSLRMLSNRLSIKNETEKKESDIGSDFRGTLQCLITPQIQCARSVSTVGQPISLWIPHQHDANKAKYQWDFGDGKRTETSKEPKIDHIYDEPGSYSITVSIIYKKRSAPDRACCTHCVLPPSEQYLHIALRRDEIEEVDEKEDVLQFSCELWPKKEVPLMDALFQKLTKSNVYDSDCVEIDIEHAEDSNIHEILQNEEAIEMMADLIRNYTLFIFDFGDQTVPEIRSVQSPVAKIEVDHTFKESGTYQVTVTAIDADGRGVYATSSVLVGDSMDERETRKPQVFVKAEQKDIDDNGLQIIEFDTTGSKTDEKDDMEFTFDFGDGTRKGKTGKHGFKPGTYQVIVTGKTRRGKKAKARLSVTVPDYTQIVRKTRFQPDVGRRARGGDPNVLSTRTLSEFFDYLKEMNFAVGRRLYLEWRPPIKRVMIDLSINGHSTQWKCLWADIADWNCQRILEMAGKFGLVDERDEGIRTLWAAYPGSNDFDQEFENSDKRLCDFSESFEFRKKDALLKLKMRYIPRTIVIDLSSLKKGLNLQLPWYGGGNGFKDSKRQSLIEHLQRYLQHQSVLIPERMVSSFKFYQIQSQFPSEEEKEIDLSNANDDAKYDEEAFIGLTPADASNQYDQQRVCRANPNGPTAVIMAEEEEQKYPQKDDSDGVELANDKDDGYVSVIFDASESVDRKGAPCNRFRFDFGDGSEIEESENSIMTHRYTADGDGNRSTAVLAHKIERENGLKGPKRAVFTHCVQRHEFKEDISIEQFALSLIDDDISLGEELCLELRHDLEDIQINVSYEDNGQKINETLYREWSQIGSKKIKDILDELEETEKSIKYNNKAAVLWFQGSQFHREDNYDEESSDSESDDGSNYWESQRAEIKDVRCESDQTLVQCIDDLRETYRFKGTLILEWRPKISRIKVVMSYNGKRYEYRQPWTDEVKQWKPEDLKNVILKEKAPGLTLKEKASVLRLKTYSGDWREWTDNSKLEQFISNLQEEGVRLEGDLVLLWKHLPKKVVVHLPYFGTNSFVWKSAKDNKLKKKGWDGVKDMTPANFMEKVQKDDKFKKLKLSPDFEAQLRWVWNVRSKGITGCDTARIMEIAKQVIAENEEMKNHFGVQVEKIRIGNHEDSFLSFLADKKVDGAMLMKFQKKQFRKEIGAFFDTEKLTKPSDKLLDKFLKELKEFDVTAMSQTEEARSTSHIWCEICIEGNEKKRNIGGNQTGKSITNLIQAHSKDAYSRLYFDGGSLENMITFSPELTLDAFVKTVKVAMGYERDQKYDVKNPLKLVYVEYKDLPFGGNNGKSKRSQKKGAKKGEEKQCTLYGLMQTLESEGIDFEEGELHLEWRPSVTSIEVDVLYNGESKSINISWPKKQETECHSIMDIIRKKDEYKKLKIPDENIGIPMLWFVAAGKVKKQNAIPETEPYPNTESKSELDEKYEHEIEDGGIFVMDRLNMSKTLRFELREASYLSAAEDVNEFEDKKLLATEDPVGAIRFEDGWTLHELITDALNQNMKIQEHIHLEWRFVPKTVSIRVPFAKRLLPIEVSLVTYDRTWDTVGNWTFTEIKAQINKNNLFKILIEKTPISDGQWNWDLWYIGPERKSSDDEIGNLNEIGYQKSADPGPKERSVVKKRAPRRDLKGEAIKFDPGKTLEEFVLMLRQRKGIEAIEPGDQMLLEYRRVPGHIFVDLGYFDVDENGVGVKYPKDDSDQTLDMDLSLTDIMKEVVSHLHTEYHVRKKGGKPRLSLDKDCILKEKDMNTVRDNMKIKRRTLKKLSEDDLTIKVEPGVETLRQFVEKLRADGIELQSTMKLEWDHCIPVDAYLNVQFQLHYDRGTSSNETFTEKFKVHPFVSHQYLIQELKTDWVYNQWSNSDSETKTLSTVYFDFRAISAKAFDTMIFQKQQNLKGFLDQLQDGMVDTKALIEENENTFKLQYLEERTDPRDGSGPSSSSDEVYFCKLCGTDVPRVFKGKVWKGQSYINPHAVRYFSRDEKNDSGWKQYLCFSSNDDKDEQKLLDRSTTEDLCQQCLYFRKMEVDTINEGSQTANQFKLILLGIFMSPAIWIALLVAMPISQNAFRTMSIIAVIISIIITAGIFYYGNRNKETVGNAGPQSQWMVSRVGMSVFKIAVIEDSFHLASAHYQSLLVLCLSVQNVLILWELMYLDLHERTDQRWNPAFECSWGLDYPPECVVYLELLGATLIVVLATLFINIAICRRPTYNFGDSSRNSLKALTHKLRGYKRNRGLTLYYKGAIDAMEQARCSQAASSIPRRKSIGFVIVSCLWTAAMIGMSFVVHPDIVLDFLSPGKGGVDFTYIRRVISILLSYFIVVIFLRFFMRTMYRLNAKLQQAFMLMKIPSNPMSFIGKEMPKTNEEMDDDDSVSKEQMKNDEWESKEQMFVEYGDYDRKEQEEEINFRDLLESWKLDEYADIMESKGWDNPIDWKELISDSVYVRDPLKDLGFKEGHSAKFKRKYRDWQMEQEEKANTQNDAEQAEVEKVKYLDSKAEYPDHSFMMAWWNLRQHIEDYELKFFFEIIFVLGMLLWAIIGFLDPDYDRDPQTYLEEAFAKSNVLLVLVLFMLAITGVMMAHLYYLMAPYSVQIEHEKWLDQMILKLEFEATEFCHDDLKRTKEMKQRMDLLKTMKEEMSRTRTAPILLGVIELSRERIQLIMSSVVTVLVAFVSSSIRSYTSGT